MSNDHSTDESRLESAVIAAIDSLRAIAGMAGLACGTPVPICGNELAALVDGIGRALDSALTQAEIVDTHQETLDRLESASRAAKPWVGPLRFKS
jgi:hypothetical protein